MYELTHYTSVNNYGTAVLLEALIKNPVERLIVASSMSIYGEGLYRDSRGGLYSSVERSLHQLEQHDWELRNAEGEELAPVPTPEWKTPSLESLYALNKYDQERMCLMIGRAYGMSAVGMRFFNAFGPNQALSNPYTGVLAIFAARLMNNRPPLIFEDGDQRRDFVYVEDVAEACRLALTAEAAIGRALNIGSGTPVTIKEAARLLADALGVAIDP